MAGYEVTLADFARLVSDPYCQPSTAALLQRWYGLDIVGTKDEAWVRGADGPVDLAALHADIQVDADKQQSLYNTAMSLWR